MLIIRRLQYCAHVTPSPSCLRNVCKYNFNLMTQQFCICLIMFLAHNLARTDEYKIQAILLSNADVSAGKNDKTTRNSKLIVQS